MDRGFFSTLAMGARLEMGARRSCITVLHRLLVLGIHCQG